MQNKFRLRSGSYESICLSCYRTVRPNRGQTLDEAESMHDCGYQTITHRPGPPRFPVARADGSSLPVKKLPAA